MSDLDYEDMLLKKIRQKHIKKCFKNKKQKEELKDNNNYRVNRTQAYSMILGDYFLGYDYYGDIKKVKELNYNKIESGIVDINNNTYYIFRVLEGERKVKFTYLDLNEDDLKELICLIDVNTGDYIYYPRDITNLNIRDKIIIEENKDEEFDYLFSDYFGDYINQKKKYIEEFDKKYNYKIKYVDIINIVNYRLNLKTDFVRNSNRIITYISFNDYDIDVIDINNKKYYVVRVCSGDISGMDGNMMWDGCLDEDDLKLLRCLIDVETGEYIYYPDNEDGDKVYNDIASGNYISIDRVAEEEEHIRELFTYKREIDNPDDYMSLLEEIENRKNKHAENSLVKGLLGINKDYNVAMPDDSKYDYPIKFIEAYKIAIEDDRLIIDFCKNTKKGKIIDLIVTRESDEVVEIGDKTYYLIKVNNADIEYIDGNTYVKTRIDNEDKKLLRCLIDVETGEYKYYPDIIIK